MYGWDDDYDPHEERIERGMWKSAHQTFSASTRSSTDFYIRVDNDSFVEAVKPAFSIATENPTPENVANMMQVARQHSPRTSNKPDNGRRLLGHTLWAAADFRIVGLYAQDKVAKGIGNQNARNAAVAATGRVLRFVEMGYEPSHRGL